MRFLLDQAVSQAHMVALSMHLHDDLWQTPHIKKVCLAEGRWMNGNFKRVDLSSESGTESEFQTTG
jgi:hypothetical protein